MKFLNSILSNPIVIALATICTLSGGSIFHFARSVLNVFGMPISEVHDFAFWWDAATRVILVLLVLYTTIRQRWQYDLFQEKIYALRELRDIDMRVYTHQINDLNEQNMISNAEISRGFGKVGVVVKEHQDRQAASLIKDMNEDIGRQQGILYAILDKEI